MIASRTQSYVDAQSKLVGETAQPHDKVAKARKSRQHALADNHVFVIGQINLAGEELVNDLEAC